MIRLSSEPRVTRSVGHVTRRRQRQSTFFALPRTSSHHQHHPPIPNTLSSPSPTMAAQPANCPMPPLRLYTSAGHRDYAIPLPVVGDPSPLLHYPRPSFGHIWFRRHPRQRVQLPPLLRLLRRLTRRPRPRGPLGLSQFSHRHALPVALRQESLSGLAGLSASGPVCHRRSTEAPTAYPRLVRCASADSGIPRSCAVLAGDRAGPYCVQEQHGSSIFSPSHRSLLIHSRTVQPLRSPQLLRSSSRCR